MRFLKKYWQLCLVLIVLSGAAKAQISPLDSAVISKKNQPQQKDFWNNTYNFPAKPRNMWEVGASLGMLAISSDVTAKLPTFGFEAHVRKALGYLFSLRLQYVNGTGKGMNWQASSNYSKNTAWLDASNGGNLPAGKGYNPASRSAATDALIALNPALNNGKIQAVYFNYKTHVQDLSLQGILSLNNVRFHKQKTGLTIYGGAGVGFTAFHTMVNAWNESKGTNYTDLFNYLVGTQSIQNGGIQLSKEKDILKALKNGINGIPGMDNTYETEAESEAGTRRAKLGKNTLKPSGTILAGISYKLSKRINLSLEDRETIIKSDLLDGQQWQAFPVGDAAQTRDYDSWNFLSLGINVNLGAKATEPLWWMNPLDYAYGELNNPKHIKFPKPVFEDADGDGVLDQLDREPNTPAGCGVDAHGVTRDTDGDGVPDCKDKQLITPTECQPVDADGVGTCPPLPCCKENTALMDSLKKGKIGTDGKLINGDCATDYPSLTLKGIALNNDNKAMLAAVAAKLKQSPDCKIGIIAYPQTDKRQQALATKKLEAVKNYLVEKLGISADRVTTSTVIGGGEPNTLDIKAN